jgi:hypothetical protein
MDQISVTYSDTFSALAILVAIISCAISLRTYRFQKADELDQRRTKLRIYTVELISEIEGIDSQLKDEEVLVNVPSPTSLLETLNLIGDSLRNEQNVFDAASLNDLEVALKKTRIQFDSTRQKIDRSVSSA